MLRHMLLFNAMKFEIKINAVTYKMYKISIIIWSFTVASRSNENTLKERV